MRGDCFAEPRNDVMPERGILNPESLCKGVFAFALDKRRRGVGLVKHNMITNSSNKYLRSGKNGNCRCNFFYFGLLIDKILFQVFGTYLAAGRFFNGAMVSFFLFGAAVFWLANTDVRMLGFKTGVRIDSLSAVGKQNEQGDE